MARVKSWQVVQLTGTIFKQIKDIGMNLLTKFHEDRTINVASRVLTMKKSLPPGGHVFQATGTMFELVKQTLPLGCHVFQQNRTNFEFVQTNFGTNVLSKFHEAWTINVASRG
ncbi:hypothetical protein DPMN_102832 [Dreissena polymorpha]|uniref:Uncharacterized protein n=1 Tax=Dreissena polymorpha TaxID=45954 RepID=A0A9D4H8R2_DREPO|nr:hypothetical protein DPMN_102832 [Dreissena polymorpha]